MLNKKGQNVAEYSILIALVIAAAIAMQTYVKRGMQGRVADAVDYVPAESNVQVDGSTLNFETRQYEPYYTNSSARVTTNRTQQEQMREYGNVSRTGIVENTTKQRDAYENIEWKNATSAPKSWR